MADSGAEQLGLSLDTNDSKGEVRVTIEDQLSDHLKKFSSGPILFVGSGVSQRYAGTPTWNTLLEQLSAQSGWPLQYYQTHVGTDPEDIAEMLASELHSKTWTPELKAWRDKNINDLVNSQSAVKIRARELVENSYKITTDPKDGRRDAPVERLR